MTIGVAKLKPDNHLHRSDLGWEGVHIDYSTA